jgi:hypothetical protein
MTLHPIPLNFLIYEVIFFFFFFISVQARGFHAPQYQFTVLIHTNQGKPGLGWGWGALTDKWMREEYCVHYNTHGLDQRHSIDGTEISFFTRLFSGERLLTKQAAIVQNSKIKG